VFDSGFSKKLTFKVKYLRQRPNLYFHSSHIDKQGHIGHLIDTKTHFYVLFQSIKRPRPIFILNSTVIRALRI